MLAVAGNEALAGKMRLNAGEEGRQREAQIWNELDRFKGKRVQEMKFVWWRRREMSMGVCVGWGRIEKNSEEWGEGGFTEDKEGERIRECLVFVFYLDKLE